MWDGFWFLANQRAWEALPRRRARHRRQEYQCRRLSKSARTSPSSTPTCSRISPPRACVFNQPDPAPFRDKLRSAGFYTEWKGKYGDEAWGLLEKAVGKLA